MLTKNYLESEYKQAIREFKAAINENAQWEARKSMAKLEMIAGQMYGFDYMDELHKLTDDETLNAFLQEEKTNERKNTSNSN